MAPMTTATLLPPSQPTRHALALPDCDCGMCAPMWARRKGKSNRFTQPVTLLEALDGEDPTCRPAMIDQHRECLTSMTSAVNRLLDGTEVDGLGEPDVGLTLLLFAGELASALEPRHQRDTLAPEQIADCEHAITGATLAAAGCLIGLFAAGRLLAGLGGALPGEPPLP